MSQSRLIAGLALAAALLLSLGWALGALAGSLLATALLGAGVLAGIALGQRRTAAHFAGAEATPRSAPLLIRVARDLADQAGLPRPQVYVTDSDQVSACTLAWGRESRIAISRALLRSLRAEDVAAVIAHELAHVRGGDSRHLARSALLLGGGATLLALGLLALVAPENGFFPALVLLSPIFLGAAWTQMALCRACEYRADAVAAALCGHPRWIAAALGRVHEGDNGHESFGSHPALRDRITRLHAMAGPWR